MPLYFAHGFKWSRKDIRIFIILHDIDDASADWVQNDSTNKAFRKVLSGLYPGILKKVPNLQFIEQYDPEDEDVSFQPYAFVVDKLHTADLSINASKALSEGVGGATWDAMGDLKDGLAKNAEMGWYAVWNGDPVRDTGSDWEEGESEETEEDDEDEEDVSNVKVEEDETDRRAVKIERNSEDDKEDKVVTDSSSLSESLSEEDDEEPRTQARQEGRRQTKHMSTGVAPTSRTTRMPFRGPKAVRRKKSPSSTSEDSSD